MEPFPDRSNEIQLQQANVLPKQSCMMCFKSYCNLYWGCRKNGCRKCLGRFIDLEVDVDVLDGLICENQYESRLFSDWMAREGKTARQLFTDCVQRLIAGEYKMEKVEREKVLDHVVCRACGIGLFRELAYQFRATLPRSVFIDKEVARPDCFYGRKCRTQTHNFEHAKYVFVVFIKK
jgi:E3 ubiquitin-protein ligase CHFR